MDWVTHTDSSRPLKYPLSLKTEMLIALLVVAVNKYGVNVQNELMEVNDQLAGRSPEFKTLLRESVLTDKNRHVD